MGNKNLHVKTVVKIYIRETNWQSPKKKSYKSSFNCYQWYTHPICIINIAIHCLDKMTLSMNSNLQYNIIMLNWISSLRVLDKKYFWMCGANNFDLFLEKPMALAILTFLREHKEVHFYRIGVQNMINLKPGGSLTIWTKFLIKNLTLIIKIKLAYMARNMFIQKTLIMRISTYIIQTRGAPNSDFCRSRIFCRM